jgi:hypothetical protein
LLEDVANSILEFKEEILQFNERKKTKIIYHEVALRDIFDFPPTNSKITKEFCNNHKGNIPVYASSKDEKSVLGYIKDCMPNIKYYENCLSWNRNGSVGYVFIRDHRFTTNEDHRALVIKTEFVHRLSREYLKFIVEINLLKNGFSFLDKCGLDKIKNVKILIPINEQNDFDIVVQQEIAEKYKKIEQMKKNIILEEMDKIASTIIEFD